MRKVRDGQAWLLCDGNVVAAVELAGSFRARSRGLLGRDGIEGAILISPSSAVHTLHMRFPIDVAHLTRDLRVLSVVGMKRNRFGMIRPRARHVLEAEWGAFDRWGIRPGSQLEIVQPHG